MYYHWPTKRQLDPNTWIRIINYVYTSRTKPYLALAIYTIFFSTLFWYVWVRSCKLETPANCDTCFFLIKAGSVMDLLSKKILPTIASGPVIINHRRTPLLQGKCTWSTQKISFFSWLSRMLNRANTQASAMISFVIMYSLHFELLLGHKF